ncbi:4-hydroxy-tetrahydrodipicolinate synthase [Candidatus Peregrinibacteria bacterium]|nr:4-hydroxy-tetrahydrodipicolinate synthase [Candidatus Peregrinibacteria bacterium]
MKTFSLQGSIVALITPFQSDGAIDEQRLRELVSWHVKSGTNAIVPCGTTGESATLSHEEHHRVIDIVINETQGRIPVIAGAGSNSTREAVSLTEHAREAGADAVLSISPYYNKPTQQGIIEHYKTLNEIGIPIIVYNVPGRTGINITAETTLKLAQMGNIVGIKEASGNMSQIMEILRDRPDGFRVYSGDDALAYPLMMLGADGCVSVVANEIPQEFSTMIQLCLETRSNIQKSDDNNALSDENEQKNKYNHDEKNDRQEQFNKKHQNLKLKQGREIHFRYLKLMETNFIETNPIPVKTALELMGKIETNFRLPLTPMSKENKEKLTQTLKQASLI